MNEIPSFEDVWLQRIILGGIFTWVVVWWRDRLAERRERREDIGKLSDTIVAQRKEDREEDRRQREQDREQDRRQREQDRENMRELLEAKFALFELKFQDVLRRLEAVEEQGAEIRRIVMDMLARKPNPEAAPGYVAGSSATGRSAVAPAGGDERRESLAASPSDTVPSGR